MDIILHQMTGARPLNFPIRGREVQSELSLKEAIKDCYHGRTASLLWHVGLSARQGMFGYMGGDMDGFLTQQRGATPVP